MGTYLLILKCLYLLVHRKFDNSLTNSLPQLHLTVQFHNIQLVIIWLKSVNKFSIYHYYLRTKSNLLNKNKKIKFIVNNNY